MSTSHDIPELDDAPHDIEFFFDPSCPFAWQTSQWVGRVIDLRDIRVGWRFVSLAILNEGQEASPEMATGHRLGWRYHRVCAAARAELGNAAVGDLYRAWGERLWYAQAEGEVMDRLAAAAGRIDIGEILRALELPAHLAAAADDLAWDDLLQAETDEAMRRTGGDVGTPIITYDPPEGSSLFGPIISEVPDDETVLAFYDAMRTMVDVPAFSELKRTDRAPLDLPLLQAS
jgi:2-hydroxychromene-2-carboxylate isomerase